VQKKISDSSSKRSSTPSSRPYPKPGKKKKAPFNKGDKPFAKSKTSKPERKGLNNPRPDRDKTSKEFIHKKFLEPKGKEQEIYTESEKISDDMRLNKDLAHAGVASRRNADELIREGRVKVNGATVVEMGYKVKPKDEVEFDGKLLSPEKKYYVLLNKPKDFITTLKDEKDRRTVMELLRGVYTQIKSKTQPRLYPVGRLDRNTTGVLLITNDGELAQKLTHPSSEIKKVYHVVLDKTLKKEDFDKIAEGGVVLEDGIAEVDEIAYPNPKNRSEIGIEIHTGKNRFIRRLFESLDYEVLKLDRVFFAGLTKKDLPRGRWKFLSETEVRMLKHFV
jgi:23S rRNA pseudouridine2605 synthase